MNSKKESMLRRTIMWAVIQHTASPDVFLKKLPAMLSSLLDAAAADALEKAVDDHLTPLETMRRARALLERSLRELDKVTKELP